MGNSKSTPNKEKNEQINSEIRKDKNRLEKELKLLLLGAGDSGKSTIAKQLKIIHADGFTKEECDNYKSIITTNVVQNMRTLLRAANSMGFHVNDSNKKAAEKIFDDKFGEKLTSELGKTVRALWADDAIKTTYSRSAVFQLNDSSSYYFDNIERITQSSYVPNEQDVLRSRTTTTGIIETIFTIEGTPFRMVDVGGQRSERKKWIHCFADVTAVIFCVAMSEYDLMLFEDNTVNRMHESLSLFQETANNKWFINTAMILFLNKKDLFAEKIKKTDLTCAFPDYTGGKNYTAAAKYITDKFISKSENPEKAIYVHETCATDSSNVTFVFQAVKGIVINRTLQNMAL